MLVLKTLVSNISVSVAGFFPAPAAKPLQRELPSRDPSSSNAENMPQRQAKRRLDSSSGAASPSRNDPKKARLDSPSQSAKQQRLADSHCNLSVRKRQISSIKRDLQPVARHEYTTTTPVRYLSSDRLSSDEDDHLLYTAKDIIKHRYVIEKTLGEGTFGRLVAEVFHPVGQ